MRILLQMEFFERFVCLIAGILLDDAIGDPENLIHPVQVIGKVIALTEQFLRKVFHIREGRDEDRGKKYAAGCLTVLIVLAFSVSVPAFLIVLSRHIHPQLYQVLYVIFIWQILALGSLSKAVSGVGDALLAGETETARKRVSMIVGRDTESLSEEGIAKAAIETCAENFSDGVAAPFLFLILFGPVGGFFYKAVNTMDSMIGYKNDRYLYFGYAAAKLDDLVNYVPSRISAIFMILAACIIPGYSGREAFRIWKRDRRKHASPNSAQTESVCAGALGIALAGNAYYFGKLVEKPVIGDPVRPVTARDVGDALFLVRFSAFLLYVTGLLLLLGVSYIPF